ncbi:mus81 structure-specific endonuclease subunit isoform X2 [Nomia melanderi]|uniref:mus81 structure-specific endonuclease subunit isoform X2 n=1 Tax=Nomia melanderi TaxID=2448451 RepID=UPI003FCCB7F7
MKRVKLKLKKPNPLFELWLKEWREEAASRNSDLQYHFSKALVTLKKYPLPLKSGKDCIILKHFGKKLCSMLDKKLEKYKAENGDLMSTDNFICEHCKNTRERVYKRKHKLQEISISVDYAYKETALTVFNGYNILSWNSENYAALFILYKTAQDFDSLGFTIEEDLLFEMKYLCGHASKDSILKLFDNGLVSMIGAPIRYTLTQEGVSIAKKVCEITNTNIKLINSSDALNKIETCLKALFSCKSPINPDEKSCNNKDTNAQPLKECQNIGNNLIESSQSQKCQLSQPTENRKNKVQCSQYSMQEKFDEDNLVEKCRKAKNVNKDESSKQSSKTDTTDHLQKKIYLECNKFDIILLVDTQETCGGKTNPQHDATIVELRQFGVLFEVRHLKVGDFAWIARSRETNNELILPYIVERKRIDDLSASITDGRFYEQKFRLKQSGIENLMYIIEEYEKGQRLPIPHSSLMQASINTLIQDGFSIKYTKNHKDSMFYLSLLTRILNDVFREKNLMGCKKENLVQTDVLNNTVNLMEFEEFNKAASKQKVFNVTQMFVRQLLQLKGMSIDKALAIVERYPTPKVLVEAFQQSNCNGELLLSNIEFGNKKRLIGSVISKTIYQLYINKILN